MSLNEQQTYYDILDLKPEASPQEIREAYLRIKGAYNKDSVALYSLIGAGEREEMLRLIEEAYETLSNSDRRKEYDRHHGLMDSRDFIPPVRPPARNIISIDRVPPMDTAFGGDDLLVPPSTDFGGGRADSPGAFPEQVSSASSSPASPFSTASPAPPASPSAPPVSQMTAAPSSTPARAADESQGIPFSTQPPRFATTPTRGTSAMDAASSLAREIEAESEWTGLFLKRVREVRNISIEELANTTKISKTYLQAIETENFPKLPASVYVRGFVIQMARALKLPQDKVAAAYMARFSQDPSQQQK